MSLHFTYREVGAEPDLRQGDILSRSPGIEHLLQTHYPSYAANAQNQFFLLLTQCCDLARRADGRDCSARYIALAPIRPLHALLQRKLDELGDKSIGVEFPVNPDRIKQRISDWLARLLNNNEPDYFYIKKEQSKGIGDHSCAHLALSIAIKSHVHYQTCLDARILALADSFRAKLGWLVGQMYSRIGTEDWPSSEMQEEIAALVKDLSVWLDARKLKLLRVRLEEWRTQNPKTPIDKKALAKIIAQLPRRKNEVLDRVLEVLVQNGLVPASQRNKVGNFIKSDTTLDELLRD